MKELITLPTEIRSSNLIVGIILITLFLYLFRKIKHVPRISKKIGPKLERIQPFFDTLGVSIIFIWLGLDLHALNAPYSLFLLGILIAGIIWSIRFFLYDIMAGLMLRLELSFKQGSEILLDGLIIKVDTFGIRSLTGRIGDDKTIKIPYSHLTRKPIAIPTSGKSAVYSYSFKLSIPGNMLITDLNDRIKHVVLNSPWSFCTMEPAVETESVDEDNNRYKITVFCLKKEHGQRIEQTLKRNFIHG